MSKLSDYFVKRRHYLILDESNVMSMLKVLDEVNRETRFRVLMDMEIGNCGWSDEPNMWFMHFTETNKQWKSTIAKLNAIDFEVVLTEKDHFHLKKKG